MDNQYSAVDILCRPGPSTILTSEDDRGIRRWEADLVVALLHVPTKARGAGGHGLPGHVCYLYALKSILVNSETNIPITRVCGLLYKHGEWGGGTTAPLLLTPVEEDFLVAYTFEMVDQGFALTQ